ncbi:hypothetical protein [Flavobacterium hydatis]|uniref:Uncharacterized protein n=1 Tax=Flavobacterium hydatis TaxID=991 RepID=A0A086ARZ4_FLAHY|nr:hypothetical protein [Flavobacterium hydatis]KFF19458.1 hypothetical protein IW20_02970 [Flavobacterium hydatis]OXA96410.1 hypothetical protein B0A62_03850 [Flavobacterium hydatis]
MNKPKKENEIWGQWITINNYQNYPALVNMLADFVGDNILGFVYIDHVAGTTLEVVKLFNNVDDEIVFTDSPRDKEIRVIIRHAQFSQTLFQVIEDKFLGDYELVKPLYIESYDRDDLTEFRRDETLDPFRAEGFPDDIKILLLSKDNDTTPELVWGRIIKYNHLNKTGISQLMVQPNQDFGINKNEGLAFTMTEVEDEVWIIGIIIDKKVKIESKPWWKIW